MAVQAVALVQRGDHPLPVAKLLHVKQIHQLQLAQPTHSLHIDVVLLLERLSILVQLEAGQPLIHRPVVDLPAVELVALQLGQAAGRVQQESAVLLVEDADLQQVVLVHHVRALRSSIGAFDAKG